jgi:hypothetical protein
MLGQLIIHTLEEPEFPDVWTVGIMQIEPCKVLLRPPNSLPRAF